SSAQAMSPKAAAIQLSLSQASPCTALPTERSTQSLPDLQRMRRWAARHLEIPAEAAHSGYIAQVTLEVFSATHQRSKAAPRPSMPTCRLRARASVEAALPPSHRSETADPPAAPPSPARGSPGWPVLRPEP